MAKRSTTELFEQYHPILVYLLPVKDTDFIDKLLEHELLSEDVKSKLESLTVPYEGSSYLLDNVIKPGLAVGNSRCFVSLLTVMKCSKHDHVKNLAIKIEKELDIDVKYLSRPELRDLHNIVIPKVSNKWYYLGIQLLNNSQVPKLDEISATYSADLQRGCLEMFKHWLNITPGATWDDIINALRAPSLQLLFAADDIEKKVKDAPPEILEHPVSSDVPIKGSTILTCQASGLGTLVYSWEKSSGDSWTTVSNDNTTSYTTDKTLAIGQYMYRCRVSNEAGSVVSNIATVNVYGKYYTQQWDGPKKLQSQNISDRPDAYAEKFKDEDVVGAFAYLFNKLGILFDEVNFKQLKTACMQRGTPLPIEFKQQVMAAGKLDDLLNVLDNPMYCNWLNTRLLKRIVKTVDIPEAKHLIQVYEECVYSRKVSDVKTHFRSDYFNQSHVSFVKTKINALFKDLTVADIIKYCQELEEDMGVCTGSITATECQPGCLQITCVIPMRCALYAYEMAKTNFLKLRQSHIQYIEIESYPKIFTMKFSSEETSKDTSQVISHCYTSLENYMDADSVSHMMLCEHLITDDDYEAITAAPNDNKMNTLLLQYVRSMNTKQLSKFCDILTNIEAHKIFGDCPSPCFRAVLQKLTINEKISAAKRLMVSSIEQMKMSEIDIVFYDLINHLYLQLFATEKLPFDVETYSNINPPFTKQLFGKIKSLYLFKIYLLPFVTWLDHSVLKELVITSGSEDAQQLLNLFNSKIISYWIQPITSFPIPPPSQLMIPLDDSEYTLLAMEVCLASQDDTSQSILILQDIMDIKLTFECQWQLSTRAIRSFQLVAVNTKFKFLYWMIPKCLVEVINKKLVCEWRSGIIKMTVLPANLNNDSEKVNKGPFSSLSFLWQDDTKEKMALRITQLHHEITEMISHVKILEMENIKLKEDIEKLSINFEQRGTEDQVPITDFTQCITELNEIVVSHMKLGELKIVKQKEDSKMTKQFGQEIAFDQEGKTEYITQLDYEISDLSSRVKILEMEKKRLKEEKRKLTKHFGQTKEQPKFFDGDSENVEKSKKTIQSQIKEVTIHQLMNIVPHIQDRWSLIGTRLKVSSHTLDEICLTANEQQIPAGSKNTFCCVKMLTSWYETSDDVSVDAIMMAIDAPHVGLNTKISTIETSLTSEYVAMDTDTGNSVTNPIEKIEQSYFKMTTKFCLELSKSQYSISEILPYLKVCKINSDVLEGISDFPELVASFEKHALINKADLSWLKNIAHYAECTKATEVVEHYESLLMADKIPWYSSHPEGTYLIAKTDKKPESVTIKDSSNAKSTASEIVNIVESDSVLQSSEVGSVTFYWKLVNKSAEIRIPKVVNALLIKRCRNAGVTNVGVMIDGDLNWIAIDETEINSLLISPRSQWEEYICPDCEQLMNDPVLTSCGHRMCYKCFNERNWIYDQWCPVRDDDGQEHEISWNDWRSDWAAEWKINELLVKCEKCKMECAVKKYRNFDCSTAHEGIKSILISPRSQWKDYICPDCDELMDDPVLTSCGHRMCVECFDKRSERSYDDQWCPVRDDDGQEHKMSEDDWSRDRTAERKINKLLVKCQKCKMECTVKRYRNCDCSTAHDEGINSILISPRSQWEEYICPDCDELMNDPVLTSCGHQMCYKCFNERKWRSYGRWCPDRDDDGQEHKISWTGWSISRTAEWNINKLLVKCEKCKMECTVKRYRNFDCSTAHEGINSILISPRSQWEEYICPHCEQLMNDPVLTSCGHRMCYKCFNKRSERSYGRWCPVRDNDGQEHQMSEDDWIKDRTAEWKINKLLVKCEKCKMECTVKRYKKFDCSTAHEGINSILISPRSQWEEYICPGCNELMNLPVLTSCGHRMCYECFVKRNTRSYDPWCPVRDDDGQEHKISWDDWRSDWAAEWKINELLVKCEKCKMECTMQRYRIFNCSTAHEDPSIQR